MRKAAALLLSVMFFATGSLSSAFSFAGTDNDGGKAAVPAPAVSGSGAGAKSAEDRLSGGGNAESGEKGSAEGTPSGEGSASDKAPGEGGADGKPPGDADAGKETADGKTVDEKTADGESADNEAADKKTSDKKKADKKASSKKASGKKASGKKKSGGKSAEDSAALKKSASRKIFNIEAADDDNEREKADKYKLDVAALRDIKLLVKAGLLKKNVYKKSFRRAIRADELNAILLSLHEFMGDAAAAEFAGVEDSAVIGKKGKPKQAVRRSDAIGALTAAVMTVKSDEWPDMREDFFGFLADNASAAETPTPAAVEGAPDEGAPDENTAVEGAPAAAEAGEAESATDAAAGVSAGERGITREEMFLLISRMLWEFERDKMTEFAPVPDAPVLLNVQDEEFYKRDLYLYWTSVKYADSYIVKIYDDAKKLLKTVKVGEPALNITKDGDPSFELIFGKTDKDLHASYTVQAVSDHGVESKETEALRFTALKYESARERYGKNYIKYENGEKGEEHQQTIALPVWRYDGDEKVPSVVTVRVHKKVAAGVEQIFDEYFSGVERFPIRSIGGFAIREKRSEHNYGTAIDINWTENFMVGPGGVVAGEFWDPSLSVYSIADGSELVRAFERHGWYWAGNGWGHTYDYMHFSFMGT